MVVDFSLYYTFSFFFCNVIDFASAVVVNTFDDAIAVYGCLPFPQPLHLPYFSPLPSPGTFTYPE